MQDLFNTAQDCTEHTLSAAVSRHIPLMTNTSGPATWWSTSTNQGIGVGEVVVMGGDGWWWFDFLSLKMPFSEYNFFIRDLYLIWLILC